MNKTILIGSAAALAGLAGAAWVAAPADSLPTKPEARSAPVVVELYQSQGCSSCPPALANLADVADEPDVLALSFGVTYWDYLGWKDRFASPAFTERQWAYAHHNRLDPSGLDQWAHDARRE